MFGQSMKMAWKSIASNKARSFLTMLGIIIGVLALVVLVSLVSSTTSSITDTINDIATNQITVMISDDKGDPMKLSDVYELADSDEISAAAPVTSTSLTVVNGSSSETATVYGTTGDYANIQGLTLDHGRFLKNVDVDNHTNVCVVSADVATDIVGQPNAVGQSVKINGITYEIIGVLESDDTTESSNSVYDIYIPYTSLIRLSDTVSTEITSFCIASADENSMDAAEEYITNYLNDRLENDEDAYNVMNSSTIMDTVESITGMLSLLLGGIAAISLLVGGIGIMNIMLVSVTERTREIGIRKAIGANRASIMLQFLLEALVVSMLGCAIGIGLSFVALKIVTVVASSYDITFALSGTAVLVAVVFSLAIGVVFGIYPANKAAKKNPIEALRYVG